jgi:RNA polymerase sigma-70 factor (ECF subfamily)
MDQDLTDEKLMLLYKENDAGAFEVLYARHKGPVYRYVLRQCTDRNIADELFQDIWMKLIQMRERYEVRAKFTTYLYTIARNRVIDYYRIAGKRDFDADAVEPDSLDAGDQYNPENRLQLQRDCDRLMAALTELPALQREAVLLKEEAGMSLQEIATLTGVNTETVKSRLRYAIGKLRQVLKQ